MQKTDQFETETISSIKAALMGPVAGIGDSFYWGTFRVIAAGIGLSLAAQGNILGPILYFQFIRCYIFLADMAAYVLDIGWEQTPLKKHLRTITLKVSVSSIYRRFNVNWSHDLISGTLYYSRRI